ncbi:hypothetical protein D3C87_1872940 [compost metagenome]
MDCRHDDDFYFLRRLLIIGFLLGLIGIEAIGTQQQAKRKIRSRLRTDIDARGI